jgi:hypothetical protein
MCGTWPWLYRNAWPLAITPAPFPSPFIAIRVNVMLNACGVEPQRSLFE